MALVKMEDIKKTPTISTLDTSLPSFEGGEAKNKGGIIGGVGYLGEKLAVGTVQSIEGISDYAIGGIAKLFGFDKFAERQFRNDWFGGWYSHPDEWFNPGKGWKVAGDVAGGIGTSLPAMAAALGVTLATGGVGAGAGAAILAKSAAVAGTSFLTAGLGAAGNATKEAYQETGKLTGKEFGYGALTGALEGGMEGITNLIGIGSGAVIKSVAKTFSKEAFESAVRKGIGVTLANSFIGEAFEEGAAEIMSGRFKRLTYDKNAENATAGEVIYSSIIGGLSGVVMGGAGSVFNAAQNTARGTQIVEKGQTEQVLALAKGISERTEAEKLGDIKQFKQVEATYKALAKSLEKTGGEVKTAYQRRLLGELKIDNFCSTVAPKMFNEAARVVNSADMIAKTYKSVDANGQPVSYTKEQILEGVDLDNLRATIPSALETNEALRNVVLSIMAGEMLMDTSAFQQAIMNGEVFAGEADLENFRKEATSEQKREVEKVLGIDNIDTVDIATFNEKQQAFMDSPLYEQFFNLNKQMKARATTEAQQITGAPLQATANTGDPSALSTGTDTAQAPMENVPTIDTDTSVNSVGENVDDNSTPTIAIQENDELAERIKNSTKSKYTVIKEFLIEKFHGQEFTLSDGKKAIMDNRDAQKLSHKANTKRTAQLGNLKSIVENAIYKHSETNVNHKKFTTFHYYAIDVKYGNEIFKLWVNIGVAKNDSSNHIYAITNRKEAPTNYGVSRPVGNAIKNASSNNSIPQDSEIVNSNSKKSTGNESKDTHKALPSGEVRADKAKSSKSMTVLESIKYAQDNVPEYAKLDTEGQARIRRLIRQAKANGFTDAETRAYARVAARSGIDIVIDKEGLYRGKDKKTGADVYADGLYSPKRNKILVNPEGTRSPARLLIHELTHAIYKGKGRLILERGAKNLTKEQKEAIWNKYFPDTEFDESNIKFKDELNAHYTEALLDDDVLLEKLCDENPTLQDKIIAFLTGAKKAYADEPTLSREAKKLYKRYKTLFDNFSARNQYNTVTSINSKNMQVGGEERFALKEIVSDSGKEYGIGVYLDSELLSNLSDDERIEMIKEYVKELGGSTFTAYDNNGNAVDIRIVKSSTKYRNAQGKRVPVNRHLTNYVKNKTKQEAIALVDELIIAASQGPTEPAHHSHDWLDNHGKNDWDIWNTYIQDKENTVWKATLQIANSENGEKILYEIHPIEMVEGAAKNSTTPTISVEQSVTSDTSTTDSSIHEENEKSNPSNEKTSKKVSTNSGDRYALPDGVEVESIDTSSSVGKKRQEYKASRIERIFTAADSVYIDTVDEYYGAEKYLRKVGKRKNAASILQAIRASISAAQTMIGDVQYDIFSDDGKKLGEGLSRIVKPITVKGDAIKISFNEYLMHWLNVDRMSLEEKSLARLEEMKAKLEGDVQKLRKVNAKIAELKAKKQSMFSDEVAQSKLDESLEKYEKAAKALKKDVREQKKQIDNFEVMQNKPIFGENDERAEAVTAEQSRKRIVELEKVHPDFRETAEKVWAYTKNLNKMRVEAGLISAESEAYMNELYPHYVPAYRDTKGGGVAAIKGRRNLAISSTVKRAKGSGLDVLDVIDSIAAQTQEVTRAGRINQLFGEIYGIAESGKGAEYVEIVSREKVSGEQVADASNAEEMTSSIEVRPKNNQVTGFVNGEKVTLRVSDEIFIAFDSMGKPTVEPTSAIGKGMQKLNDIYKKLITSWSPKFLINNPIRDIQDAGLNSKHPKLFIKNLAKVYKLMFDNAEIWQEYRAYGGYSASIFGPDGFSADVDKRGFEAMAKLFDTDAPTMRDYWEAAKRGGKNLFTGINNVNAFVEQATRFAEYVASREAGDSIPTAINNAAEVTTNFGRRGRLTKKLNATIMPFLNPSIQGFDKMFRNVGDAFKEGSGEAIAKALGALLAKAAIIGMVPMVFNMLLHGDDEDYEDLREEDKENNFLIKVGEGKFIKIPRGRVASVIGGAANRTAKLVKGEDADIKGYLSNVVDQVTPVQNFTRTIFSPFFDAKNNLTWYGTAIEGREFDNTAPKDRYDENTSSIAIAIGKVTKWSPKKIHYVLDQYSGVIGDFVLPVTTSKAERDFFSGNFVIDAATSNKISAQFYEMYDKAQYARTAGDDTAIYQVKYLNKVKNAISEMHDEKSKVQNDKTLSSADKLQKSRTIQILINEAYKSGMADYELYTQAVGATQGIENTEAFKNMFEGGATDENIQKIRYTEAIHLMYGAERALKEYNSDVYERSQLLNLAGVDYENIYQDYFSTKSITSDTDKKGNIISGSKRKKIVAAITAMKIPTEQKLLLIASKGYSLQDGDIRGLSGDTARKRLLNYILKLNVSKEQKIALAEMCGFEVKNGKIILKK